MQQNKQQPNSKQRNGPKGRAALRKVRSKMGKGGGKQNGPNRGKGNNGSGPVVPPAAPRARLKTRHIMLFVSFLIMVVGPISGIGWYLYERAADQYASTVGFSVKREAGSSSAQDLFGGIVGLSSGSSSDTDVLFEYIRSQEMVALMDEQLDLRSMWSKPENDPFYTIAPDVSIETLHDHWNRMVTVFYDSAKGIISVRALAFDPVDARQIADAVLEESAQMINRLSEIAREDTLRFARAELEDAEGRLSSARQNLESWRTTNQIVDPQTDVAGQSTLLNSLQAELTQAIVDLELLLSSTRESDPRVTEARRRVEVIERRIQEERDKFGADGGRTGEAFARLVSEYQALQSELLFSEEAFVASRTRYDAAVAEAQRQSRYLAPHIRPTLAETSQFPEREQIVLLAAVFIFLLWVILSLVYYSIKDRR